MSTYYEKQYSQSNFNYFHLFNDVYYSTDLHCHDFVEVYLCISGGKYFLLNDTLYDLKKGDLFIVNSLDVHRVIRQEDICYERYVLEYKPSYVLRFCTPKTDLMHYLHHNRTEKSNKITLEPTQFEFLVELMEKYELIDENDYGSELKKELGFIRILLYVAEIIYKHSYNDEIFVNNINSTVTSLLSYISDNLAEDLSLEKLASEVNISKHYLCSLFKKNTGITIHNYISSRRIAYAKKLLLQGDSITEISEKTGFNSLSNFTRTFRRITGISPSNYIKQELKK